MGVSNAMADLILALAGGLGAGSEPSASVDVGEKGVVQSVGDASVTTGRDGGLDSLDLEYLAVAAASNFVTGFGYFQPLLTRPPIVASGSAVTSKMQITIIPPPEFPDDPTECEEGGDNDDLQEVKEDAESEDGAAKEDMRQHADDADDLGTLATPFMRSSSNSVTSSRSSLSSLHITTHPPIEEVDELYGFDDGNKTNQTDSAGVSEEDDASPLHDCGTMMQMKPPLPPLPPSARSRTATIAQA
ncbi:hypothetical protein HK102_001447 [Quaeritorhiza haematococci]|nr:hypothetical protein HK102_001447 [Quaeritorhiza haematococci]